MGVVAAAVVVVALEVAQLQVVLVLQGKAMLAVQIMVVHHLEAAAVAVLVQRVRQAAA
jgi:hypothetical protein